MKRKILKELCLAQYCSMRAKNVYGKERYILYAQKSRHIKTAINLLKTNKIKGIIYKIDKGFDQNNCPSNIYYFEIYLKRGIYQISFHGFEDRDIEGHQEIVWDEKDSYRTAKKIDREYQLNIF